MNKSKVFLTILMAFVFVASFAFAVKSVHVDSNGVETALEQTSCTKIQGGELLTSDNAVIEIGFDMQGYNYQ
ncbi:hypothetical protein COU62_04320 [Candidatus Pacearchaeota archaeon CG10_big_fil_rev_8_21_14_0_10_35_219]|nr:hypothetical protein [Candidatus Pacearchaeota archaeon]OIO42196.1 MAG: hypothetical protein AUJ63_02855 [Candidatus Pacearchaeota archaeon CG1_02_35_32]PIO07336.1 MAG: hypothetical protein COU62_04320 [Candidatus Pacearchaeota archaeon CG10_big_fil_rev_8_21_14_0_10_35_219]PIY81386.1 MAG: hypothetical protein COY79_03865 [Candidatus Pacearchaeota archaeon CG_4_10_14_0_8_um_filter_35_169]PIZ79842.1 MAG: hypothetical protein COY00_03370 [Candidatus Pacearchaeota archaeon CG_4_10_14_0_2_um_filt